MREPLLFLFLLFFLENLKKIKINFNRAVKQRAITFVVIVFPSVWASNLVALTHFPLLSFGTKLVVRRFVVLVGVRFFLWVSRCYFQSKVFACLWIIDRATWCRHRHHQRRYYMEDIHSKSSKNLGETIAQPSIVWWTDRSLDGQLSKWKDCFVAADAAAAAVAEKGERMQNNDKTKAWHRLGGNNTIHSNANNIAPTWHLPRDV